MNSGQNPRSDTPATPARAPVTGASILVIVDNRAVIVQRGKEPSKGLWALPGGRQEIGESLEETARRELLEETSLIAEQIDFLQLIEPMKTDQDGNVTTHYVLGVYLCHAVSGQLQAGDDAAIAQWVRADELSKFEFTPTSLEILQQHL